MLLANKIIVLTILLETSYTTWAEVGVIGMDEAKDTCADLSSDPDFDHKFVMEKSWTIYYTFKLPSRINICTDVSFKNATEQIIEEIRKEMSHHLSTEPNWETAHFLMLAEGQSWLLFPSGIEGQYEEIPTHIPDELPMNHDSPSLKLPTSPIFLKLWSNNKFLSLTHCLLGFTVLMANKEWELDRDALNELVATLDVGEGSPTCSSGTQEIPTEAVTEAVPEPYEADGIEKVEY